MRYPSPAEVGAASAMATLGALPLGQVPEGESNGEDGSATPSLYAIGSVAGSGLGGGLVGFVAGGDVRGAATGSLLTAGLASMASSAALLRRRAAGSTSAARGLGVGLGVFGLIGVGASIYLAGGRR